MPNKSFVLYHGSNKIIRKPEFGKGRIHNDYGPGFYCTQDVGLAREWAAGDYGTAYVNKYSIELDGLKILDLGESTSTDDVLRWLATLLENRSVRLSEDVMRENANWLISKYAIDLSDYDIVSGYRADDSYFTFARSFVANSLSFEQLTKAMKMGRLGKQIMIKSQTAFSKLKFESAEVVDRKTYYDKRLARDLDAREEYNKMSRKSAVEGTLLVDIIRRTK